MSGPARAGRGPAGLVSTGSGDPRPRGGPLHRSAAKSGLFFWTVQSRSRWRLCRLTLDSRSRLRRATDVASPLRGDAAYPLRVRPVCLRPKCRRKRRLASDTRLRAQSFQQDGKENGGWNGQAAIAAGFPRPKGRTSGSHKSRPCVPQRGAPLNDNSLHDAAEKCNCRGRPSAPAPPSPFSAPRRGSGGASALKTRPPGGIMTS